MCPYRTQTIYGVLLLNVIIVRNVPLQDTTVRSALAKQDQCVPCALAERHQYLNDVLFQNVISV